MSTEHGPRLTMDDAMAVADAMVQLARVSKGRIACAVIPASWTEDQGKRLARVTNKVLEAGEAGLRCIERAMEG